MSSSLFGTDGIRGRPGFLPLDEPSLIKLGDIIGRLHQKGKILIGRDTRESGEYLESLLCRGIGRQAEIFLAGIIPTPAIPYLLLHHRFTCGIMISASHNPYDENGIKLFNRRGEKISPQRERQIERLFFHTRKAPLPHAKATAQPFPGAAGYLQHLLDTGKDLRSKLPRLVVDTANGSAAAFAPELFRSLNAAATFIHCSPDGQNINRGCGSTSPQSLGEKIQAEKAELGIAFDGDADRVVFMDGEGHLLEGDHALFLLARYFQETDPDFPRLVVGTVMSNLGLEHALSTMGFSLIRADVGDRSVYLELKRRKALLGGEPSGHIILRQFQPSGDGLLTALVFLKSLLFLGLNPGEAYRQLSLFPHQVVSLPIKRKKDLRQWQSLKQIEKEFFRCHGSHSRLLVRYSGTEPKIRIMIESQDENVLQTYMDRFATLIRSEIGR